MFLDSHKFGRSSELIVLGVSQQSLRSQNKKTSHLQVEEARKAISAHW